MSTFAEIKARCLKENKLFEDPDFPATNRSINPVGDNPGDWLWRRPVELSDEPVFIIDGATTFDLIQGELGDCWFVAACAVLATEPDLFDRVVPAQQSFKDEYAGIFKFNFWHFGEWREVYVDDKLPVTMETTLRFSQNRAQPNEYWGALLEKAYAKLYGSYRAIDTGQVKDAMVDMTGGLSEDFNLRKEEKLPPDLFEIMQNSHKMGSLMGCCIWGDAGLTKEELMWNGLYKGHVYSVTGIVQARIRGWHVQLVRLRNPWGLCEWTGAWSDGAEEWDSVPDEEINKLGLVIDDDGEFWMAFKDFLSHFHALAIVHLGPETFTQLAGTSSSGRQWQETVYHGRWIKGVNSGGSGLLADPTHSMIKIIELYYTNPQYCIKLKDPDPDDVGGDCTCVVSLLQKDNRKRRNTPGSKKLIIGFDIHQVKRPLDEPLTADTYFDKAQLKKQFQTRTPLREVTCRYSLPPGTYCIIPNTLRPQQEGDFLLRIYTYTKISSGDLDSTNNETTYKKTVNTEDKPIAPCSFDLFSSFAGEDYLVDARDLRDLLGELAKKEFGETLSFGIESCRSLIAMLDKNDSGVLDYDEMTSLWDEVVYWKKIFKRYDKDKSGCIETYELRRIFRDIGFSLPLETISALVVRYGGKDRNLFFEDFTLCLARTVTLYTVFKERSRLSTEAGQTKFTLDQFLQTMLYL